MKILHGAWIPQTTEDFIQTGGFYLWVETTELKKQGRKSSAVHPRQLSAADLVDFLTTELGVKPSPYHSLEKDISPQYFLLPTVDNQPLPSLELSRYLEEDLPEAFEFQYWRVDCYKVSTYVKASANHYGAVNNIIKLLNEIHFIALHNLAEVQLGSDLLFWYFYTQAFKQVIFKDQYIPALKYRELTPAVRKSSSKTKQKTTKQKTTRQKTTKQKNDPDLPQRRYIPI